jgi:hypothetical protein
VYGEHADIGAKSGDREYIGYQTALAPPLWTTFRQMLHESFLHIENSQVWHIIWETCGGLTLKPFRVLAANAKEQS